VAQDTVDLPFGSRRLVRQHLQARLSYPLSWASIARPDCVTFPEEMSMPENYVEIGVGINEPVTLAELASNIQAIIDQCSAAGVLAYFGEIPNPEGRPEIEAANAMIREHLRKQALRGQT
jgi:hypothetical protein